MKIVFDESPPIPPGDPSKDLPPDDTETARRLKDGKTEDTPREG